MEWISPLMEAVKTVFTKVASVIPNIVGVLVIIIIGWIVARIIQALVKRFLRLIRFDQVASKAGITQLLEKGEIRRSPAELFGRLAYWLIMLVVLVAAISVLGLKGTSELLGRVLAYLPNVLVALVVLVFGMFIANFVSGITQTAAKNIGLPQPRLLSQIARVAIIILVVAIALEQLGIGTQIVISAFSLLFGALCLALALSFGLGGKDWAKEILANLKRKSGKISG